ncbi:MAG: transporter substrate-binding domain-containing protein [Colwellia sp.]|nr:transporter substrate-binding domain-containing protein [Colwellia sp.]NQZ81409.1 transporter substrate-binding domain-containing protein [Colwellia sp.]
MQIKIFLIIIISLFCFFAKAGDVNNLRIVAAERQLLHYIENGKAKGPTAEITNALLKELSLTTKIDFMPWPRAFDLASKRANTLILSIIRTPERENDFHWIGIVSELSRVFISLEAKPENLITTDSDIENKVIGVTRNSNSYHELVSKGFKDNLYIVTKPETAFKLLISGKVDLVYHDPNAIKKYIELHKNKTVKVIYSPVVSANRRASYLALSINSDELLVKSFKEAMNKYQKTKEYRHLLMKKD